MTHKNLTQDELDDQLEAFEDFVTRLNEQEEELCKTYTT